MKTVQEIIEWVEEHASDSLQSLREESNHNSNHLATAYSAEYDLCERLKEFIYSPSTTEVD